MIMAVSPKCICPELLLTMPLYIYSNPFFFFCFVLFLFNLFSRYRYADFENLIVYRVWWGYKESMIKGEGDAVAGSENFDSVHPKKLFVQGLPKLTTEAEAIIRRAELERAFVKYGGKLGAIVTAPLNCTFAFVELESQSQAEQALLEQSSNYRISKARRSRFEALQEQREAMKQAKGGPDEEWE